MWSSIRKTAFFSSNVYKHDHKLRSKAFILPKGYHNVMSDAGPRMPPRRNASSIRMPSLSPTMTEGTIVQWHKAEGDTVQPGDLLCDIQTDKAVVAFELEEEGVLARVLLDAGADGVQVGQPIAVLAEPDEDWRSASADDEPEPPVKQSQPAATPSQHASLTLKKSNDAKVKRFGPAVRLLLQQYNLSASDLPATGPDGTLLKSDVLSYVQDSPQKQQQQPAAAAAAVQPLGSSVSSAMHQAAAETAAVAGTAYPVARPQMQRLEPRTVPHVDHEVSQDYCLWAQQQLAIKSTVPHSYVKAACSPCQRLLSEASLVAAAVHALAMALDERSGSRCDLGVVAFSPSALPSVLLVPRANALGLKAIDKIVQNAADANAQLAVKVQAVVCDLSYGSVLSASLMLTHQSPLLLTIGQLHNFVQQSNSSEQTQQQQCTLSLTFDSRLYDDAEAASLLSIVKENLESPLLGFAASSFSSAIGEASASTEGISIGSICGSDLLQLGLDD